MVQKLFGLGIGGTGIVATLIVAGILLTGTKIAPFAGSIAITAGIGIGICLGLLGIFGVAKRVM